MRARIAFKVQLAFVRASKVLGAAIMVQTVPRDLFDFLASVDANTKERSKKYLCKAAAPLMVG